MPTRLLLLALALTLGAVPALADTADCFAKTVDGPEFCTQQVWFTSPDTKAGNLGATPAQSYPSWDTEPPSASVTEGAGAGFLTVGPPRQMASGDTDPYFGATFEGTFTGNLDNILVELYLFAPAAAASDTGDYVGSIELEIDGELVLWPTQATVPLEPGGDAASKTTFAMTNLREAMVLEGLDVGEDVEHEIRFFFSGYGLASGTAVVVFDTSEVPSGMTFNVPDLGDIPQFQA